MMDNKSNAFLVVVASIAIIFYILATQFPVKATPTPGILSFNGLNNINKDKVDDYNQKYLERFQTIIMRSKDIHPDSISEEVQKFVCGPAALYASIPASKLGFDTFKDFLTELRSNGLFRDGDLSDLLQFGMATRDLNQTLKYFRLGAESFQLKTRGALALRAVLSVDEGRIVLAEVDSDKSYEAISGSSYPSGRGTAHIVAVVAVQRDSTGTVTDVGLYDVNVYSGQPIKTIPLRFVPYSTFVDLLGMSLERKINGIVVSNEAVYNPLSYK